MTWYNNGQWGGVKLGHMSTVLNEIGLAINERNTYVGRSSASWSYSPYGERVTASGVLQRIAQYRSEIESIVTQNLAVDWSGGQKSFYNPATGTKWTVSSLLNSAGYGSSWLTLTRPTLTTVYDQLRKVVDNLAVIRKPIDRSPTQAWDGWNGTKSPVSFEITHVRGNFVWISEWSKYWDQSFDASTCAGAWSNAVSAQVWKSLDVLPDSGNGYGYQLISQAYYGELWSVWGVGRYVDLITGNRWHFYENGFIPYSRIIGAEFPVFCRMDGQDKYSNGTSYTPIHPSITIRDSIGQSFTNDNVSTPVPNAQNTTWRWGENAFDSLPFDVDTTLDIPESSPFPELITGSAGYYSYTSRYAQVNPGYLYFVPPFSYVSPQ